MTVSIDFSKAFDTVPHTKLISALTQTTLRHNTVRWLIFFLRGRMTCCRYNYTTSPIDTPAQESHKAPVSPRSFLTSLFPPTPTAHS